MEQLHRRNGHQRILKKILGFYVKLPMGICWRPMTFILIWERFFISKDEGNSWSETLAAPYGLYSLFGCR